jgi:RNA polymerase sigma factor (sigma-70 family)
MRAEAIPERVPAGGLRSKRLLALAGDAQLVEQIRRGNEAAFEVAFERHGAGILGFCRHMLGSREEAEDAVQHTFTAAFRDLRRDRERPLALRPWLYSIARNRCVSVVRARRERPTEEPEPRTAGLAEQVERRAELRDLLRDLRDLPEDQRAALLLSEAGGLCHADIANVLGCEEPKVKALVFRARSGLIQRRAARETPCEEIREQLANLRGGSLRRGELRHHLRECAGCRAYREQVSQQRRMLAAALPVVPSLGLKSSVLGAVGLGGGSAGGGLAAGLGAAGSASFGSATVAKVALVGVLAGGGAVAGQAVIDEPRRSPERRSPAAVPAAEPPAPSADLVERAARSQVPQATNAEGGRRPALTPPGAERRANGPSRHPETGLAPQGSARGRTNWGVVPASQPPADVGPPGGHGQAKANGHAKPTAKPEREAGGNGRGPIEAPPPGTPVRRGPREPRPAAARPAKGPAKVKAKAPAPAAAAPDPAAAPAAPRPQKAPKAANGRGHSSD